MAGTAGLHVSGPPMTNQGVPINVKVNALPFSSTPLVASAAAGGSGVSTRRSYPGALVGILFSHIKPFFSQLLSISQHTPSLI